MKSARKITIIYINGGRARDRLSMSEEFHYIGKVAQKVLVVSGDTVLIVRDARDNVMWELPGGRLHYGESLEAGIRRELREELGVEIILGRVVYSEQFHQKRDGKLGLLIAYEAHLGPGQVITPGDGEVVEYRWIKKEELENFQIYDNCLNALTVYFKK